LVACWAFWFVGWNLHIKKCLSSFWTWVNTLD
jgi:hypothetical protein